MANIIFVNFAIFRSGQNHKEPLQHYNLIMKISRIYKIFIFMPFLIKNLLYCRLSYFPLPIPFFILIFSILMRLVGSPDSHSFSWMLYLPFSLHSFKTTYIKNWYGKYPSCTVKILYSLPFWMQSCRI